VGPVSLDLVRSVAQTEPAHTETVQPVHSRKDEKEDIIQALAACGNNRARTAEMLGISTVTLWRKLKKYGLEQ
jgi:DNA-binding NtrC family response regulator